MMYILWEINVSLFNQRVIISDGCIADSTKRMDIVELAAYEQKWWYFTLIPPPTWIHGQIPIQCQGPTVIFRQFTHDSWWICTHIISQDLHLFEDLYDRNGLAQHFSEWNVLTLIITEGYFHLKLRLPHNWICRIWYEKYWAREFCIRFILGIRRQLIPAEVSINP